ncbi:MULTISPECIES: flagellar basal-body rod protein FlgF [Bradyrhizobium]|uniref:Flagellar basal-body rod protein FlgF n=1 Tax=Bradyrhizobium ottawaense TaxID=931866 RepID=A0A2U8PBF7_9BRAD|nr:MULTISPECIES: flagellar basal-body rod protein FlgF [Bradyrhizobium]AWL95076.1 flagellar basal-body rod protein FlgF [Bradyrhizobium ottawaense]MBR1294800.1 flagellar basal-body rod protein FlgF [Bradyrhizobium ottawaense]MBR1365822.1 flagellar basal-body rod protein FlgF [Bradyrhizobium ottawaense]MDA9413280.1 flagellar basal body rod protein FlgF [Bradyrhizobium sp. CCBAU 25360]MDA9445840.1 flagellar basal body rod protein FlgF [Bradyrhizobium sp. CCBAU 21360]
MQNALLIGLSRQMTLERQMDVIANNVANANTNGFKADHSLFEEYLNSNAREDNFIGADRRVSYVQDRGTYRDIGQGPMEPTNNPLDMAIDGNAYFAVQANGGEMFTRDGKFSLNATGQLVTPDGNLVLGTGGPITFQPTDHDINVAPDGTITVLEGTAKTDSIRGKIRMASFDDPTKLTKLGANLYAAGSATLQPDAKSSSVRQGYVEKSNVNSVGEMTRMVEVMRSYTAIANLLQQQSDLHKSAIEKLADVPA